MILGATILGLAGLAGISLALYYTLQTLQHFWENPDVSLATFFLREEIAEAFELFSIAAFIFAASMFLATIGHLYRGTVIGVLSEAPTVGSIIIVIGFAHFCRTVGRVTAEYHNTDQ